MPRHTGLPREDRRYAAVCRDMIVGVPRQTGLSREDRRYAAKTFERSLIQLLSKEVQSTISVHIKPFKLII